MLQALQVKSPSAGTLARPSSVEFSYMAKYDLGDFTDSKDTVIFFSLYFLSSPRPQLPGLIIKAVPKVHARTFSGLNGLI